MSEKSVSWKKGWNCKDIQCSQRLTLNMLYINFIQYNFICVAPIHTRRCLMTPNIQSRLCRALNDIDEPIKQKVIRPVHYDSQLVNYQGHRLLLHWSSYVFVWLTGTRVLLFCRRGLEVRSTCSFISSPCKICSSAGAQQRCSDL